MHELSRRDFLHVTAGAGALGSIDIAPVRADLAPATQPADASGFTGWFESAHALGAADAGRERSGTIRPVVLAGLFTRLHADAATLSAGGIVAYYPTNVPLHHRSAWLGESDPSAPSSRAAARAACTSWRARIRMPSARTSRPRIRTWILIDGKGAAGGGTGPIRAVGDLCAGPLATSTSWTRSTRKSAPSTGWTGFSLIDGRRRGEIASAWTASSTSRWLMVAAAAANVPIGATLKAAAKFLDWRTARLTELWKRWTRRCA